MKATGVIVLATIIAALGQWSKGKGLSSKMVIGGSVLAFAFSLFENSNPKLANQFAWLVFAGIVSSYGETLFTSIGTAVGVGKPQKDDN